MRKVLSLLVAALTACSTTSSQMRPTVYQSAEVPAATARVNEDRILEVSVSAAPAINQKSMGTPVEEYLAEMTAEAYKQLGLEEPPSSNDLKFVVWLEAYSRALHKYSMVTIQKIDQIWAIREQLRKLAEDNLAAREMIAEKLNELDSKRAGVALIAIDLVVRLKMDSRKKDAQQFKVGVEKFERTQRDIDHHMESVNKTLKPTLDYFADLREVEGFNADGYYTGEEF